MLSRLQQLILTNGTDGKQTMNLWMYLMLDSGDVGKKYSSMSLFIVCEYIHSDFTTIISIVTGESFHIYFAHHSACVLVLILNASNILIIDQ